MIITFACGSWVTYIHLNYAYTMPYSPQPQIGRVHRIVVNHGYVVYVTAEEFKRADFVLHQVFWIGFYCTLVLMILVVYWKVVPFRSRL